MCGDALSLLLNFVHFFTAHKDNPNHGLLYCEWYTVYIPRANAKETCIRICQRMSGKNFFVRLRSEICDCAYYIRSECLIVGRKQRHAAAPAALHIVNKFSLHFCETINDAVAAFICKHFSPVMRLVRLSQSTVRRTRRKKQAK